MNGQTVNKTIGIVGGMGPEAGYALGNSILKFTNASKDQQHLPVVLVSYPQRIGDRTAFLEGEIEENPGHEIAKLILQLEKIGVEVAGLACNTAHAAPIFRVILQELLAQNSLVKLLNMPWETCNYLKKNHRTAHRVGIMTSTGAYRSQIYHAPLRSMGYEAIVPDAEFQDEVIHRLIYDPQFGIKANPGRLTAPAKALLNRALDFFEQQEAELLIMGCTEIPVVLKGNKARSMQLINPTDILAQSLIASASSYSEVSVLKTY